MSNSGAVSLKEAMARALELGKDMVINLPGGIEELRAQPKGYFKELTFDWRSGIAAGEDEIPGNVFYEEMRKKSEFAQDTPPVSPGEQARDTGHNSYDRTGFSETIQICRRHGDDVLVGFDGGRAAIRRAPASALHVRLYKWDWAANPIGVKDLSNWFAGRIFIELIDGQDALRD